MAVRRLAKEFKELMQSTTPGVLAGPVDESDFFKWEALIAGPEGTPFEYGVFRAILTFPRDYPHSPPTMKFTSKIVHPNIYTDGKVCISILHAGVDPSGYEKSCERWSPVQSVEKVLLSVISMLADPNDESPANVEAAKLFRADRSEFDRQARESARLSLFHSVSS
eukprot:m.30010 g.30010  ORF g.30010 m.30010 type:complete len:166 (+) comp9230_c0_seq1:106-603(+)